MLLLRSDSSRLTDYNAMSFLQEQFENVNCKIGYELLFVLKSMIEILKLGAKPLKFFRCIVYQVLN